MGELKQMEKERSQSVEAVEVSMKQKEEFETELKAQGKLIVILKAQMSAVTEKYKVSVEEAKTYLHKSIETKKEVKEKMERIRELETTLDSKSAICEEMDSKIQKLEAEQETWRVTTSDMKDRVTTLETTLETER